MQQNPPHKKSSPSLPRVRVLATGGTIAGTADSPSKIIGYQAGVLCVEALLSSVPELTDIADISGEQICNIDSKDITDEIWLRLANRVTEIFENDEAGAIVITHGTDTMEETAFFLDLTVNSDKPIILTGAMRPATAKNPDGPGNLLDAVRTAISPEATDKGVLVVINDTIHTAREVTKTHTMNPDAFRFPENGPLGIIENVIPAFHREPAHRPANLKFDIKKIRALPRVDILYGHQGDDGALAEAAVKAGAKGIVYAGLGNGSIPAPAEKSLTKAAEKGVIVIRATHVSNGPVVSSMDSSCPTPFIDSGTLNPQKARVLLRTALSKTNRPQEIAYIFKNFEASSECVGKTFTH